MSYIGRSSKLFQRAYTKVSFLATAGQTSKTGLSYVPSFVEVYVNGVLLTDTTDFTATNGNSITFTVALLLNDEVTVISLKTFTVADHYSKTEADTLLAAKATNTAVALKAPIASPVFTGNVGIGVTPSTATIITLQGVWGTVSGWANNLGLMNNAVYNDGDKYINTDEASKIELKDGTLNFKVAPSGTADAAISWTTAMTIDNAGIVTKPLQPAFCASANAQDNLGLNAWVVIAFENQRFDQNQDYAANKFTAPVTGKYQLQVSIKLSNLDTNTGYYQVRMRTSNRSYRSICDFDGMSTDPSYWNFNISVLADMDAGDTCEIDFRQASGSQQTDINTESYFSCYLVA